jgi:Tfp pilus assembly protein PilO
MAALLGRLRASPPTLTLAVALAAFALAGAGGALVLLAPARARTAALEERRAALESEVARARAATSDLARSRRERIEMEGHLEAIRRRLPTEGEMASLYRNTHDAAASTGLAVSLFQPRDPRLLDYHAEIPISIAAEGTYRQLARFLERLAGFTHMVTVSALQASRIERPGASLRAEMTLTAYVYRPAAPGGAGGAAASPAPPASASAPRVGDHTPPPPALVDVPGPSGTPRHSPRPARDPFEGPAGAAEVPATAGIRPVVGAAALTGIVRGPQGPLALLETADGVGHVLRPGDSIDAARLLRIDREAAVFEIGPGGGRAGETIILPLGPSR